MFSFGDLSIEFWSQGQEAGQWQLRAHWHGPQRCCCRSVAAGVLLQQQRGRMQRRRAAEQEDCREGGMQRWRDAEKEGCRERGLLGRMAAGKEDCREGGLQRRMAAPQLSGTFPVHTPGVRTAFGVAVTLSCWCQADLTPVRNVPETWDFSSCTRARSIFPKSVFKVALWVQGQIWWSGCVRHVWSQWAERMYLSITSSLSQLLRKEETEPNSK